MRRAFTDREAILKESGVNAGSSVLEVGAGNGFFTEVLAKKAYRVRSIELQKGMVEKLKKRLRANAKNVEIIEGDIADIHIPSQSVNTAFLYYSFHEIDKKESAAKKIGDSVTPGGYVSIYEPTVEVSRAKMEETIRIFEVVGFVGVAERIGIFTRFAGLRKVVKD